MDKRLADLFLIKAQSLFCVVIEDKDGTKRLVMSPGTDKPYALENKKVVEDTAKMITKQTGKRTAVLTLEEAFNLLLKSNPGFEKSLLSNFPNL